MNNKQELKDLEGRKVKNINPDLNIEEGRIKSVENDPIYKGDTLRALITYNGNIGREGVVAQKLLDGDLRDWELVE